MNGRNRPADDGGGALALPQCLVYHFGVNAGAHPSWSIARTLKNDREDAELGFVICRDYLDGEVCARDARVHDRHPLLD